MQISSGFTYAWSTSGPACDKVAPESILSNGNAINPSLSYRITVNNFLADGGDKLYVLAKGNQRLGGAQDVDALEAFFKNPANDADTSRTGVQIAPGSQNRITLFKLTGEHNSATMSLLPRRT